MRALRAIPAAIIAVLIATLPTSAGAVTVTLGAPDPAQGTEPLTACTLVSSCLTKTVIPTALSDPGATLTAPADGTITSWRVKGAPPAYLRLRVVARQANGAFKAIATSGIAKVSDGLSDNSLRMAIEAGQQLGLDLASQPSSVAVTTLTGAPAPAAAWSLWDPALPDGASSAPAATATGTEPLFNATVELSRPTIFQLSPASAPLAGAYVYITGRHLTAVTGVTFGGVPARILEAIPEQVLVLAPPHATGRVDVVLSTAGGPNLDSPLDDFTYLAPRAPAPPDRTKPRLWGLRVSPKAFLASPSGPSALPSAALGAEVSYRLSEAATVTFTVKRRQGRRYVRVPGGFEATGKAGRNRLRFSGRVNRRPLAPGRYRLLARAADAGANRSEAKRRGFRVVG